MGEARKSDLVQHKYGAWARIDGAWGDTIYVDSAGHGEHWDLCDIVARVRVIKVSICVPPKPPEVCGMNPYTDDTRITCKLPKGHTGWCSD